MRRFRRQAVRDHNQIISGLVRIQLSSRKAVRVLIISPTTIPRVKICEIARSFSEIIPSRLSWGSPEVAHASKPDPGHRESRHPFLATTRFPRFVVGQPPLEKLNRDETGALFWGDWSASPPSTRSPFWLHWPVYIAEIRKQTGLFRGPKPWRQAPRFPCVFPRGLVKAWEDASAVPEPPSPCSRGYRCCLQ